MSRNRLPAVRQCPRPNADARSAWAVPQRITIDHRDDACRFAESTGRAISSNRMGEHVMASLEQVEISRYHNELVHDVRHLVQKYGRIMGWEVPELDEAEAKRLIFNALKDALADVEREF
jgi:hypothetical protein